MRRPSKMNDKQALECVSHKLVKIYNTETGKKFILHLLKAFNSDNSKVLLIPKDSLSIEEHVDCITNRFIKPVFMSKDEFPKDNLFGIIKEKTIYETAYESKKSDKLMGKLEKDYLFEWAQSMSESDEDIKKALTPIKKSTKKPMKSKSNIKRYSKTSIGADKSIRKKLNNAVKE